MTIEESIKEILYRNWKAKNPYMIMHKELVKLFKEYKDES